MSCKLRTEVGKFGGVIVSVGKADYVHLCFGLRPLNAAIRFDSAERNQVNLHTADFVDQPMFRIILWAERTCTEQSFLELPEHIPTCNTDAEVPILCGAMGPNVMRQIEDQFPCTGPDDEDGDTHRLSQQTDGPDGFKLVLRKL